MFDGVTYAIVALTFLLAGMVKGSMGSGFSTVALCVLTVTIGLPPAMALILAPSFVVHLRLAVVGGHAGAILSRLWLFLLAAIPTVWFGVSLSLSLRMWSLMALLGVLLVAYSVTGLWGWPKSIRKRREIWANPVAGFLSGAFTGMTGAFELPGMFYFRAIGLRRNALEQATAILCVAATLGLALSLYEKRLFTNELVTLSAVAVMPSIIGVGLGRYLHKKAPTARMRRLFFVALLASGLYLLAESL